MKKNIKSPLNYTGGKGKLLPQIIPLFPSKIETFVDLFCGGCNVGINVTATKKIFNDNQTFLIGIFDYFQSNNINLIIEDIENVIKKYNLSLTNQIGYNELRNDYNLNKTPLFLLCLIFYSFNHGIRFNNNHMFNMPFGKNKSQFNDNIRKNLISFKKELNDVIFTNLDYITFIDSYIELLTEDDFVYLDPPYLISTATYNDGKRGFTGWNKNLEEKLLDLLLILDSNNIKFALSNVIYHKNQKNELLSNFIESNNKFNCHYLNFNYDNSSYQGVKSEKSVEILLTNY